MSHACARGHTYTAYMHVCQCTHESTSHAVGSIWWSVVHDLTSSCLGYLAGILAGSLRRSGHCGHRGAPGGRGFTQARTAGSTMRHVLCLLALASQWASVKGGSSRHVSSTKRCSGFFVHLDQRMVSGFTRGFTHGAALRWHMRSHVCLSQAGLQRTRRSMAPHACSPSSSTWVNAHSRYVLDISIVRPAVLPHPVPHTHTHTLACVHLDRTSSIRPARPT